MSSNKIRASITGVHGYVPDYILSNSELEKLVDTLRSQAKDKFDMQVEIGTVKKLKKKKKN